MAIHPALERRVLGALLLLFGGLALTAAFAPAFGGGQVPQDMPGALNAAHIPKPGETDCSACHVSKGRTDPAKCLACHTEIASRIEAGRGYHRDKGEDCAVCHAEHQGREESIVPLDRADFDHSETGADLRGAHLRTKDCDKCHAPANTLPRTKGRSYLLRVPGCRGCHAPPHPGDQDECLECHGQDSWIVERHGAEG